MVDIVIDDPPDVKLRRAIQQNKLPEFGSAAELQAWLDEIDSATTIAQLKAVVKDKLKQLAVAATLQQRQQ